VLSLAVVLVIQYRVVGNLSQHLVSLSHRYRIGWVNQYLLNPTAGPVPEPMYLHCLTLPVETVKPDSPVEYFGPEATAFVRRSVGGKTVSLQLDPMRTRDKYGRLLAYVILPDGRNLNLDIVATGHGYADPRFDNPLKRDVARAQREARKAVRGLWAEVKASDLPRYYRGKIKLPDR